MTPEVFFIQVVKQTIPRSTLK